MSKQNAAQRLAAKLKVLAKAATPGPWVTDGDYANEHGNVLYTYIASKRRGGRIANTLANCLVKTDEQCRANAEFIAEANPKAVLVLCAEIERLKDDLQITNHACFLSVAENKKLKHELDAMTAAAESIRDEWRRDQVDLETLIKNNERYQWIQQHCDIDYRGHRPEGDYGSTDESVDAAMNKAATQNNETEIVSRHVGGGYVSDA
ncbi:ead/Ea22-like family protein [Pseudomonas chlororaphis]|uniref:ead/Ea22-like family protein n=1 Tax=Pseudomonas chlororaphis TaxID=587753 RepID=UPI0024079F90|nr:ead/Ea22-like family protein [Pseudomonas chlororaphis]